MARRAPVVVSAVLALLVAAAMAEALPAEEGVDARKIGVYKSPTEKSATLTGGHGNGNGGGGTVTSQDLTPASILQKLDWRAFLSTAMNMFFGNNDEQSHAASRQLVHMILSLIDGLRLSFTMRRAQARSGGVEETTTDAALAGLSMLKAYVKSITAKDAICVKRYLCQANRDAVKEGNKIGYMIAQLGSYATSYVLESLRYSPFTDSFGAAKEGRNGANCEDLFHVCNEVQ